MFMASNLLLCSTISNLRVQAASASWSLLFLFLNNFFRPVFRKNLTVVWTLPGFSAACSHIVDVAVTDFMAPWTCCNNVLQQLWIGSEKWPSWTVSTRSTRRLTAEETVGLDGNNWKLQRLFSGSFSPQDQVRKKWKDLLSWKEKDISLTKKHQTVGVFR